MVPHRVICPGPCTPLGSALRSRVRILSQPHATTSKRVSPISERCQLRRRVGRGICLVLEREALWEQGWDPWAQPSAWSIAGGSRSWVGAALLCDFAVPLWCVSVFVPLPKIAPCSLLPPEWNVMCPGCWGSSTSTPPHLSLSYCRAGS